MATVTTRRGSVAADQEPLLDNNTDYGGGLESQRRRQIGDAYRNYSGGQEASEDIYQRYLRDANYETGIQSMFAQSGAGGGAPTTFSDPATHAWEQATRAGAQRLLTPLNNPDFQPYVDYMRRYFQQLQQPGYTAAEQDLMQTQALDPMERQRQAARRQVQERMARSGIANGANGGQGGLVERAMQDVDRQFNEMRTRTQSGFAASQINADRQRQAQAAQVGASLSQAQQAAATNDEGRMMQALSLLWQIPQYADSRLQLANSVTQPMNPAALIAALSGYQQGNQQQGNINNSNNAAMWQQLGQLLWGMF